MLEKTKQVAKSAAKGTAKWTVIFAIAAAIMQLLGPKPNPTPSPVVDPTPVVEAHTAPYAKLTAPATGICGEPIVVTVSGSLGKSIKLREQGFDKTTGWISPNVFDSKGQPVAIFMARQPLTLHSTLVVGQGDETDIAQCQTVFTAKPGPVPVDPPVPIDPPKPPDPPKPVIGDANAVIVVTNTTTAWKNTEVTAFLSANGLHDVYSYSTTSVAPNADPIAMKWVGESASDGNTTYPFYFVADTAGNILEKGAATNPSVIVPAISKHLKNPIKVQVQPRSTCAGGNCP